MTQWHVFHIRKRTPFYVDIYTQGMAYHPRNLLDFDYHFKLFHINGKIIAKESEFQSRRCAMLLKMKNDPRFLLKALDLSYKDGKAFIKFCNKVSKLNFSKMSDFKLAQLLNHYADMMREFWAIGLVPLYIEDDLAEKVRCFMPDCIMSPIKEGIVGKEYKSLLKIAILPKSKRELELKKHCRKFAWMANQLYTHSFFSLADYRQRLLELKNPKKLLEEYNRERKEHLQHIFLLMSKLNLKDRIMARSLNEAIFYRSWRGEIGYYSAFIVSGLFEEISARLKIKVKDLLYYTHQEIVSCLLANKKIDFKKINARKKGFVYLPIKGGKIITGKSVLDWEKKNSNKLLDKDSIKGVPAFAGFVRGIARVIKSAKELPKIKKGDILIAPSTTPMYVPILKMIKAIVVEEGGVLSHASVIAREMKIPCVIGAKEATKVFKDGDLVEVDATRGIVRKIH